MKSVMNHNFSQVPKVEIPRSVFDRSHGYKTTLNEDYLIPFYVDEALPGDTFAADAQIFCRMITPIVPVMDNLYLDTFFFAVPNRLLWEHWVNFMGEKLTPLDSTVYNTPIMDYTGYSITVGSLTDYFGLPLNLDHTQVNSLPFRAYLAIYDSWFRDQNLIAPYSPSNWADGPDDPNDFPLLKRAKQHDYFTSALPWPQKGPTVPLPLGTTAPVIGNGMALGLHDGTRPLGLYSSTTIAGFWGDTTASGANYGTIITPTQGPTTGAAVGVRANAATSGLIADLSNATAATINSLRQAWQLQRLYERDARGGTRYIEMIKAHFGVTNPDFRMQRPEYLGGGTMRINVNPVQQTSSTDGTSPQGNLAAFAVGSGRSGFTKSFTEHCTIIGLVNIRADLTYQKGLNRMWSRRSRFDYYFPANAHLGEQEIYNKEIYCKNDSNTTNDDGKVFGYQERFAEYRYYPSQITGLFRSELPTPIDIWHWSQKFTSLPVLDQTFIESAVPIERTVAVKNQPHFMMDSYIKLHCARPMPVYSVPGMVDHF